MEIKNPRSSLETPSKPPQNPLDPPHSFSKTVLCIVDGLGIGKKDAGDATVVMDNLWNAFETYPSTTLLASGPEVGLVNESDAGNSEVGHNAIGSGQRIKQGLALLDESFESGEIFKTKTWKDLMKTPKLNVIILLSDGRVHSDIRHLFKVLANSTIPVSIHACLDGRDVAPQGAMKYVNQTNDFIEKHKINAKIAVVGGRSTIYMDRYESNPDVLRNAFDASVAGAVPHVLDIEQVILHEHKKNPNITDENLPAFILEPDWLIKNGDGILLLNYRGDRALQTVAMFENGKYLSKEQFAKIDKCLFTGVLEYDTEAKIPKNYLCPPPRIENTLTEWLCKHGVKQFTVAETVKFGHLTYFFNGNRAKKINEKLETWVEIKSSGINHKMRAKEITQTAIDAIKGGEYDLIKLNLANPDIVGHLADLELAKAACMEVDECIGMLIGACSGVNLIITSDHGNAEEMLDENGKPKSSHTNNLVPFIIVGVATGRPLVAGLGLTNIASTVCELLGVEKNSEHAKSII